MLTIPPKIIEHAELTKVQMEEAIQLYLESHGFEIEKWQIDWKTALPSDIDRPVISVPVKRKKTV